jgi:hypothetical protein
MILLFWMFSFGSLVKCELPVAPLRVKNIEDKEEISILICKIGEP